LLDSGFPKKNALEIVTNKFLLSKEHRLILLRGVFPASTVSAIRRKLVLPTDIRGKELRIDGYNTMITVESVFLKKPVLDCDDGLLRDISGVFGRHRVSDATMLFLQRLKSFIEKYSPRRVEIYLDKPVSMSGELASLFRKELGAISIPVDVVLSKNVDTLVSKGEISASSDIVVVLKANKVIDLPRYLVLPSDKPKIIRLGCGFLQLFY